MKKFSLIIVAVIFMCGCSNGLDKSIIEPLAVDEIKANIKDDSSFTDFYKMTEQLREWLLQSNLNQAEYGEITYKRLFDYYKKVTDEEYGAKLTDKYQAEYNRLYPDYTEEVDSIMAYWQAYREDNRLENYVHIEFDKLWKEHYSYSGDVRAVNVGFKITPLRGDIQQLIFEYDIKSKISNSEENGLLSGNRCLASSPISAPETLYWKADYSDEKYLKNMSTTEVKRDYDIIVEVVEVRIDGVNVSEKVEDIPHSVYMALEYCKDGNNYYADDIIRETIDPDYITFYEYSKPKFEQASKAIDPDVHNMLKAFHDSSLQDADEY